MTAALPAPPTKCSLCKGPTEEQPPVPGVSLPLLTARFCPTCDRVPARKNPAR